MNDYSKYNFIFMLLFNLNTHNLPFAKRDNVTEFLNLPTIRDYFENTNIMNKSTKTNL